MRAFEASGRSEQEFADMYGMKPGEVARTLERARAERQAPVAAAAAVAEASESVEPAAPVEPTEPAAD